VQTRSEASRTFTEGRADGAGAAETRALCIKWRDEEIDKQRNAKTLNGRPDKPPTISKAALPHVNPRKR